MCPGLWHFSSPSYITCTKRALCQQTWSQRRKLCYIEDDLNIGSCSPGQRLEGYFCEHYKFCGFTSLRFWVKKEGWLRSSRDRSTPSPIPPRRRWTRRSSFPGILLADLAWLWDQSEHSSNSPVSDEFGGRGQAPSDTQAGQDCGAVFPRGLHQLL